MFGHPFSMEDVDKFWSKMDTSLIDVPDPDACGMIWTGYRAEFGHGTFWAQGRNWKAHRVAWMLEYHVILPPEVKVLHKCDNPPCCDTRHLFVGTQQANIWDMANKGRHGRVKFPNDVAGHIREEVAIGPRGTAARLATELGVSRSCISKIANGIQRA